ncbi:SPOC domain protein [Teladorsagia circumcincta]|uniref:SPOC domain protein n=1 Tax=Teladorsagia circumcincta TaxID=45464 RepID=A0A2G9TMX1_TELCI|nr:SPOC domain protein [Teladorsagia circumcincta]
MNLRISGFDDKLEREEIKEILANEFRRFAPFEIKVVRNPGDEERLAYVNFERRDCARKVRYTVMDRLRKVLGRRVLCDPAGILRDQEGKYIPDRFNRALQWRLKEDDSDATRTLFVGNMPSDIRESEIRKVFERYGKIEDIDIKTPANTDAAYAFVMFQNLEQAMEAKHGEHDRSIRPGSVRCKIGYGKSQSGAEFAYIRFADTNAATDACRAMKNFPLGGRDRCIMVDFAKDDTAKEPTTGSGRKRRATKSPVGGPRTPPGSPKPVVKSFEELDEEYATTWQGQVMLKKTEYSIRLYRIGGTERLIQKLLRDDDGNAVKLHITQRLALSGQEGLLERLMNSSSKQLSLMIAVGKQMDDIRPLVRYLTDKDAAGVVTVTGGLLYIFPHSDMASKLMTHFAPTVRIMSEGCPFLFFVLGLKTSSAATSPDR